MNPPEEPLSDRGGDEALERALRFIEYRPRSAGETRQRLKRWGYDEATVTRVVTLLEVSGILDDRDFARAFMNEMVRKGYGCRRVSAEMYKKRLPRDVIEETMAAYPQDEEIDRAVRAAEKAAGRLRQSEALNADNKLVGYLMRRGYTGDVARKAVSTIASFDTNNSPE